MKPAAPRSKSNPSAWIGLWGRAPIPLTRDDGSTSAARDYAAPLRHCTLTDPR